MITLIAAIGKNNELGKNNNLIWRLPGDLKFFKEITLNHPVIMGYKTYESIGKPLPNRRNILITSRDITIDNVQIYHSFEELFNNEDFNNEYFVIGGASLYNYFYPLANKIYLTKIDAEDKEATVFFPQIDYSMWIEKELAQNEDNGIKYKHVVLERKKK